MHESHRLISNPCSLGVSFQTNEGSIVFQELIILIRSKILVMIIQKNPLVEKIDLI